MNKLTILKFKTCKAQTSHSMLSGIVHCYRYQFSNSMYGYLSYSYYYNAIFVLHILTCSLRKEELKSYKYIML